MPVPGDDNDQRLDVREIEVPVRPLSRFEPLLGAERYSTLQKAARIAATKLRDTIVWNVSSTAAGGGVAEMLQVLTGYTLDAGVDMRWLVIEGDPAFFATTKRIHNRLHGVAGDVGELGPDESAHYSAITAANARSVIRSVRPGDVVLLHDPQTAGMATALAEFGAKVVWRCHIGWEKHNEWTDQAWDFLRGHLAVSSAFVFSVEAYIPSWIPASKAWVIPPSIDPFSPKNQELTSDNVLRILRGIGMLRGAYANRPGTFTRRDGTQGTVTRSASILSVDGAPLDPTVPLVVQISRWDRLKDMVGVMIGFASAVADTVDAELALVGPATADVSDDPEEGEVFAACVKAWEAQPVEIRRRIRLVTLPMDDIEENAAMVNAIQHHSTVVVQKSLAEGFGLTVAEAMWKAKAVVASSVGGITGQVPPGTGLLLRDPADLSVFGVTLADLLAHPDEIAELGVRARQHVLEGFVGDTHLMRYPRLIERLVSD